MPETLQATRNWGLLTTVGIVFAVLTGCEIGTAADGGGPPPEPINQHVTDNAVSKEQVVSESLDSAYMERPSVEPLESGETAKEGPIAFHLEPRQKVMGPLVNYYRPLRIQLDSEPKEELVAEPDYASEKPLYGTMQLGAGSDTLVTLVVDEAEGETPRIYIDRNNDEDLTNDGAGEWSRSGPTLGLSGVAIDVEYESGTVPYTFEFYRFTTRLRDSLLYYRNSGREGEITSEDERYKVVVLDENADGRFDDLDNGTLIIDLNQDGTLVGRSDSAEYYKLDEPFNIHGRVWEVASLSPDGTELQLRPSDASVEMKPYLTPGYPAPAFTGKDLDDNTIDLANDVGDAKYILLDFWASWCGPCRTEYPYLRRMHAQYRNHGLKIIGINLDSDRDKAVQAAEENLLTYPHVFDEGGWKNAVAVLYRVHGIPAIYLLDQDLNIVAKGLRGSALEKRMAEMLGPGDTKAAAEVDALIAARKSEDQPESQTGKSQILVEVSGNPKTVAPGEKTTLTVTVRAADGTPLSGANVTVSAGGGKFLPSADTSFDPESRLHSPYSATGTTDKQGQFTTWWVCNPCAAGYVLSVEASKGEDVSPRTEHRIVIKR